jgi:nitric oxide reductase subunit B
MWVPMGSMFSFIEVLPLVLLIIEAINNYRLIKTHQEFKYRLAYTYVIGATFWNFVGAGVFGGGTLNAPLVNYYEHGTFLTLNHAHTALFGAFGELAIGLIYFCLRYIHAERPGFSETLGLWAFWLYNGGLVLWILFNFSRSAGRSSTLCMSMVLPMLAATPSTTRRCFGSGCGCRAMGCSRSARC